MEVPKFFLSDMEVQDQFLPWTKNGGGSVTIGRETLLVSIESPWRSNTKNLPYTFDKQPSFPIIAAETN